MTVGKKNLQAKKLLSAKDYVQAGLIAQWDGIENQGYGKHADGDIAVWKDLVGDADFTINRTYLDFVVATKNAVRKSAFKDTGARWATTSSQALVAKLNASDQFTYEVCFKKNYSFTTDKDVILTDRNSSFLLQAYFSNSGFNFYINASSVSAYADADLLSLCTASYTHDKSGRNGIGYVNGINACIMPSQFFSNQFDTLAMNTHGGELDYYTIRFYDRVLTPEEVALNAEIDKVRFA